ncbi:charged multivesicular body protein 1 [Platysternon megacephalum]|uniref:UbiA prenyltransferase domain-containing protein 1 n=1 Tax=Platysternon megacephalum TaxID=55544 RepID=A0A4D9DJY4_9SAUR|nr:charged multivesicular body protein 1 [Platysternon megacephalum]
MASARLWWEGLRPKSLPAAVAPVLAGTAVAVSMGRLDWVLAVLCLLVALTLQIGVNFANDYSDGIRGADDESRVGPQRLVGSGVASPSSVKAVAFAFFGLACVFGLAVVVLTGHWWMVAVGALCVLAAWFYTGGSRPYGYFALGEVMVFVFFGLVAVCGTTFVQVGSVPLAALVAALGIGAQACAILVTDNLRDIHTDPLAGKTTLATVMGEPATRTFFVCLHAVGWVAVIVVATLTSWWLLLALAGVPFAVRACAAVRRGDVGMALLPVMKWTGLAELLTGAGLLFGALLR